MYGRLHTPSTTTPRPSRRFSSRPRRGPPFVEHARKTNTRAPSGRTRTFKDADVLKVPLSLNRLGSREPSLHARKVVFKCAPTSTSADPPRRGGKTLAHGEAVGISKGDGEASPVRAAEFRLSAAPSGLVMLVGCHMFPGLRPGLRSVAPPGLCLDRPQVTLSGKMRAPG